MSVDRLRSVVAALWVAGTVALVVVILRSALTVAGDPVRCEWVAGSSVFGTPSWSWFPLGTRCTYRPQQPDLVVTVDPPWERTVLLVAWLVAPVPAVRWSMTVGRSGRP